MSPTQRTLKALCDAGYQAAVVEKRLPRGFVTVDLFGWMDVLAYAHDDTLAVQCTTTDNQASRVKKLLAKKTELVSWLSGPRRAEVWGWKKYAQPINRRYWRVTRQEIVLDPSGNLSVQSVKGDET